MIILGVDPGKATGVAVWVDGEPIRSATARGSGTVLAAVKLLLGDAKPDLIACERFTPAPQGPGSQRLSYQPDAGVVCGILREYARTIGCTPVWQSPGPAKKIAPNSLLTQIGWKRLGQSNHEHDAMRHVLLALASFLPERFAQLTGI